MSFFVILHHAMNQLQRAWVWLRRIWYSRGFGVQSPSDYRFVRYVINEHWPYYAYDELGSGRDWLERKVGELLFRLANWRRPSTIINQLDYGDYLSAGCRSADLQSSADGVVEMACVPITCDFDALQARCDSQSLVVIGDVWRNRRRWQSVRVHPRVRVAFDLYYCGILLFDPSLSQHHYIVNF